MWHVKNVLIGSMKNWSSVALEWNLANDPKFEPHTPGGCTECKGALTIDGSGIARNVAYYIIAQASKFVPAGSIRIESSTMKELDNVAFLRPDGKIVLIVLNERKVEVEFEIKFRIKSINAKMNPNSAASFVLE
jgi:glucosylceramidase